LRVQHVPSGLSVGFFADHVVDADIALRPGVKLMICWKFCVFIWQMHDLSGKKWCAATGRAPAKTIDDAWTRQ
ncbi:MAG: hypothetical protein KDH17_03395, partial [Rhodocyclaceae bacterium]|nr:hypothetical protein [Rhodocyclaceae bacterium]